MIKNLLSIVLASVVSVGLTAQTPTGAQNISNGEVLGVSKAVKAVEVISTAKKNSISVLKNLMGEEASLSAIEAKFPSDDFKSGTFERLLNDLDAKYKARLDEIKKDNVDDNLQLAEKSQLNKYYSMSVSSQCFSLTSNDQFVKTKDQDGNEIVAFPVDNLKTNTRYGQIDDYHQGFARIKKDQVYGFLNFCGEEVIPAQFEMAEPFNDGKALVKKFIWYFVDVEGNESDELVNVVDAKALTFGVSLVKFKNNKFALIDNNYDQTKKPLSALFDQIETFPNTTGLFRIRNGKTFGILKINGQVLIDPTFDKISASEDGKYFIVERNKKMGLYDANGAQRIAPNFESIESVFVNKLVGAGLVPIVVKDESGLKIYELTNNKVSNTFTSLEPFNNQFGLAKACALKGGKVKCGYVNYEGSEVVPLAHDALSNFSKYGMVVARDKFEKCSDKPSACESDIIYNKEGQIMINRETIPSAVKYVITDTVFSGSLVIVRTEFMRGDEEVTGFNLIDKVSHQIITSQPYNMIKKFNDDMILALAGDKFGIIDFGGKVIVKPQYKDILNFSEGLFGVRYDNNKLGYVDRKGKVQVTFEYTEIAPFKNGLAVVGKNGKFGIISKFNAKIAPCYFDNISAVAGGNFELTEKNGSKYLLNSNGDCITNCAKFDDIRKKANNQ